MPHTLFSAGTSPSPQVVNAVKAAVVERPHPVDVQLAPCLLAFLSLIADEDRNVRRAAVVALSAVAHHKVQWRMLALLRPLVFYNLSLISRGSCPFSAPVYLFPRIPCRPVNPGLLAALSTPGSLPPCQPRAPCRPVNPGLLASNMCRPPNSLHRRLWFRGISPLCFPYCTSRPWCDPRWCASWTWAPSSTR